jgi:acyl carrier protein
MATSDDIKKKLREFIIDTFLIADEDEELNDSDSFMQTGLIDSTGILEVITFLELEFSISVEDDEMIPDNLDSVDNLVKYVMRKTG